MSRITKAPDERRLEIVQTAERLFRDIGYAKCSVDRIIREMGVAKGTFYYYFKSKEDVLEAIADRTLEGIAELVGEVATDPSMDALTKMKHLLANSHIGDGTEREVADMLHMPQNRELHEATNIRTIRRLSPIFAQIIEQGNKEGVFSVERPLETFQILLTGAHFLLDGGLFDFSEQEIVTRRAALQEIVEKSLGAEPGSFAFMNPNQRKGDQDGKLSP